jgi:hypothetical protein
MGERGGQKFVRVSEFMRLQLGVVQPQKERFVGELKPILVVFPVPFPRSCGAGQTGIKAGWKYAPEKSLVPEALELRLDFVGYGGAVLVGFQVVAEGYKLLREREGGGGGSGEVEGGGGGNGILTCALIGESPNVFTSSSTLRSLATSSLHPLFLNS